jgi:hypothetical protein
MMSKETAVLLSTLQAIGAEWQESCVCDQLLRDANKLSVLLAVDQLAWERSSEVSPELIREHAPAFNEQFKLATLRELGAPVGHLREVAASAIYS